MSEETVGAQVSAPLAIISAILASSVLGYIYLIAPLFSVQASLAAAWSRLHVQTACAPWPAACSHAAESVPCVQRR